LRDAVLLLVLSLQQDVGISVTKNMNASGPSYCPNSNSSFCAQSSD